MYLNCLSIKIFYEIVNYGLGIRIYIKILLVVGVCCIIFGMMWYVSLVVEGVGVCGVVDFSIGVMSCGMVVRVESGWVGENVLFLEWLMLLLLLVKCMIIWVCINSN